MSLLRQAMWKKHLKYKGCVWLHFIDSCDRINTTGMSHLKLTALCIHTSALEGVGGQGHDLVSLVLEAWWAWGQSGRMWKIMAQPGLAVQTVQPVASCYTDYAVLAAVRSWINSGRAFCYLLDKLLVCISVYQIGCPDILLTNHQSVLFNIPEERRPQQ